MIFISKLESISNNYRLTTHKDIQNYFILWEICIIFSRKFQDRQYFVLFLWYHSKLGLTCCFFYQYVDIIIISST